jgi:hypothetical protein
MRKRARKKPLMRGERLLSIAFFAQPTRGPGLELFVLIFLV